MEESLAQGRRKRFNALRKRSSGQAEDAEGRAQRSRRILGSAGGGDGGYYVAGDRFATTDGVHAFVGFCLEMNFFDGDAERLCQNFAHLRKVRAEFRLFGNDHGIDVLNDQLLLVVELADMLEEDQAVGTLPLGIGVRKMCADVAETGRAEQGIAKSVGQHVSIGVTDRTFIKGEFDTTDDEFAPCFEAMEIVTNP